MKSRGETEETMRSDPREKTIFLAEKLRRIRDALGLSQTELLNLLDLDAYYEYSRISLWERGHREPPVKVVKFAQRYLNSHRIFDNPRT